MMACQRTYSYHFLDGRDAGKTRLLDHSHLAITAQDRYAMSCRQLPVTPAQNSITHLGLVERAVIRFARMHHAPSGRVME